VLYQELQQEEHCHPVEYGRDDAPSSADGHNELFFFVLCRDTDHRNGNLMTATSEARQADCVTTTIGEREQFPRSSGILLHPTSLPGRFGIGDLGPSAFRFVDWLSEAGQSVWQILPLGPTTFGDSPYQTLSAFAGNPLLVSLEHLVEDGWLTRADLVQIPDLPSDRVDYGWVIHFKHGLLARAAARFRSHGTTAQREDFTTWCAAQSDWLEDYALFAALKDRYAGKAWTAWPSPLALREPGAISGARTEAAAAIADHKFQQWVFFRQWGRLREYTAAKGIRLFGDLPIFVAHDSCDVWVRRDLFQLGADGAPTVVAGVPPDYFSETGQLWGNPLYDWKRCRAEDYAWWIGRLRAALACVDIVRLDHFRGFAAYWEVPASAKTAVNGRWVAGPGAEFFTAVADQLGRLPIVAEDLGVITPEVEALRDRFDLPGMKVLQFAWSDPTNLFLPHAHRHNCVVYSGTHDNDPTLGWWHHDTDSGTRHFVQEYLADPIAEANWTFIRLGMMSGAHTFIATMQDVLGLGREARMNLPGAGSGNWDWRMPASAFTDPARERLARLTWLYRRRPDQRPRPERSTGSSGDR